MKKLEGYTRFGVFMYRIVLILVLLTLCRVVYLVANWHFFAPISTHQLWDIFRGGLLFDICSLEYTSSLFIILTFLGGFLPKKVEMNKWYRGLTHAAYLIPNALNLIINIGDAGYYTYSLKRLTMDVFTEFGHDNMVKLLGHLALTFWPYTLLMVVFVAILIFAYFRVSYVRRKKLPYWRSAGINFLLLTLTIWFFMMSSKGWNGIKTVPINGMWANRYCERSQHRALVLNSTYTFLRTSLKPVLKEEHFFSEARKKELFDPEYIATPLSANDSLFGSMKGRNIVFIILESFAAEHTGFFNQDQPHYPGFTPNLDALAANGLTYQYAYANGRKSVEAMPSALASMPSMGFRFVDSHYSSDKLKGLPEALKNDGYTSTFYHGGVNGSMGFDVFTKSIGFQHYFGKNEFHDNSQFDGLWGIFDEPFLQRVAKEIDKAPQPSLSTIFTLSSHSPYTLPEAYQDKFMEGHVPLHKVIAYSDMALGKFFDTLQKSKSYNNTLFVIMADHSSETYREEYNNPPGRYRIPIIFFDPQGNLQGLVTDRVAQQADILPTLLYLLGNRTPIITYGHNLLDDKSPHFAVEHDGKDFYLITKDYCAVFDPYTQKGNILAPYPYVQTSREAAKAWVKQPQYQKSIDVLKAIVQDYNYRLIHDKLSIGSHEP